MGILPFDSLFYTVGKVNYIALHLIWVFMAYASSSSLTNEAMVDCLMLNDASTLVGH